MELLVALSHLNGESPFLGGKANTHTGKERWNTKTEEDLEREIEKNMKERGVREQEEDWQYCLRPWIQ